MLSFLKRPYQTHTSLLFRLSQAALFGAFVFAFLYVFRPFGIGTLGERLLIVSLGFGMVTFLAMLLLNVILPLFFKNFYTEQNWTLGKEIMQTVLNITVIGAFNFLFFSFYISHNFSWVPFLWFQFSAFAVGIFPVTVYLILKEKSVRNKYEREAEQLSGELKHPVDATKSDFMVTFPSNGSKESLTIEPEKIFYIQSSDNYLDIFYGDNAVQRSTIRNTLKAAEVILHDYPGFMRCHRSFIVNLEKVVRITGNAQGYKLHLDGVEEPVPVARQFNDRIKARLTNRP